MSKITPLPSKKVIKALENMGFEQRSGRKAVIYFYSIRMEEPR